MKENKHLERKIFICINNNYILRISNQTGMLKAKSMSTMKKVLVIEDEELIRKSIIHILNQEGYIVFFASNGQQGLELAKKMHPDLILCDILMPKIDGFQVLEKMKRFRSEFPTPFIFLSGLSERENLRHGMELGADDYITKPFSREELLNAVSSRIQKYAEMKRLIEKKISDIEGQLENKLRDLKQEVEEKNSSILHIAVKNELLDQKLQEKEIELAKEKISSIEINNALLNLNNLISKELDNSTLSKEAKTILTEIKSRIKKNKILCNNWTLFQLKFNQKYPDFISNLNNHVAGLTQYEMVFISAHLMGFHTNQLAELFNITEDSVRKSRYRLKKKLGLKKEDDFLQFIHQLNIQKNINEFAT